MNIKNSRYREVPEDLANRIQHKNLTRSSIVDEYFPTAIIDEAMTNPCVSKEQKKVPMTKIRFGDLKKDDVFWFAGKQLKKLDDEGLHAVTLTNRGKESFMFFKHNLVNVENKKPVEINIPSSFEVETINYFGMNITSLNPIEPGTTFISDSNPEISNNFEKVCKEQGYKFDWNSQIIALNGELCNKTFRQVVDECRTADDFYHITIQISSCCLDFWINSKDSDEEIEQKYNFFKSNTRLEQGKIFLDVQPVSEDYVQRLLR